MKPTTPWLVLFGTRTAIVRAGSEEAAFVAFRAAFSPDGGKMGRKLPPERDEVAIRRPTEGDRGWIEDSGNPEFLALLPELVPV